MGFSDTVEHALPTDTQNKSRRSTDAEIQFEAGSSMLRCRGSFPGKELGGAAPSLPRACTASVMNGSLLNKQRKLVSFSPFFVKVKILFRFLLVSNSRY